MVKVVSYNIKQNHIFGFRIIYKSCLIKNSKWQYSFNILSFTKARSMVMTPKLEQSFKMKEILCYIWQIHENFDNDILSGSKPNYSWLSEKLSITTPAIELEVVRRGGRSYSPWTFRTAYTAYLVYWHTYTQPGGGTELLTPQISGWEMSHVHRDIWQLFEMGKISTNIYLNIGAAMFDIMAIQNVRQWWCQTQTAPNTSEYVNKKH